MPATDTYEAARRKAASERRAEQREQKWVLVQARPKDASGRSPALAFVGVIWDLGQQETGHSWQRLNGSLYGALEMAIRVGLIFHEDDFVFMGKNWSVGFWFGVDGQHGLGERLYKAAVESRNFQACRAFEKWRGRDPFIFDGTRLAHDSEVPLPGPGRWKVTSFSGDGKAINLCAYEWKGEDYKPTRRRKLSLEEVRGMSRAMEHSRKEPGKVFCVGCGEHRESEGRCQCGSVEGVKDGRLGTLSKKKQATAAA